MYRMNRHLTGASNRFLALLTAGILLLATGCQSGGTSSQEPSAADSSVLESAGPTVSQEPSSRPDGQLSYEIETPPLDKLSIPEGFSIAPVQSGDPNFVPGSLYKGEKLTFRTASDKKGEPAVGMWVWDCRMIKGISPDSDMSSDMLLDMLIQNGITEIYLGMQYYMDLETQIASKGELKEGFVSEMELRGFIKKCSQYGIRVSMLTAMVDNAYAQWARKEDESQEYRATKVGASGRGFQFARFGRG